MSRDAFRKIAYLFFDFFLKNMKEMLSGGTKRSSLSPQKKGAVLKCRPLAERISS